MADIEAAALAVALALVLLVIAALALSLNLSPPLSDEESARLSDAIETELGRVL